MKGEEPSLPAAGPLLNEAKSQFGTMKTTLYQYRTQVDLDAGDYRYDCVGFVSYSLQRATPQAWASVFKATGIGKGRIPSPPKYQAFFAGLSGNPQEGWQAVAKASELRPGDVVAWEQKTESAVGHAVIIAGVPVAGPEGAWQVEVYDSTSSPHSDDSRTDDERAQKLASNGRRSGLGRGVMVFMADPATGALAGLGWSLKAKTFLVPIAAGRPVF